MKTQCLSTLAGRVLMAALILVAMTSPVSAQLADTVWPMFQHDARHTGRSAGLGPVSPFQVKFVQLGVKIKAQPSIGEDGSIYVGVGWKFCAVSPSLAVHPCTKLPSDISASTVAIDVNKFAYLGDRNNSVSGFSWNGSSPPKLECRYNHGHEGDVNTSPAIGLNGTVYFAQGQSQYGLGPVVAIEPAPDCGVPPVGDASGEKWHIKADTTIGSSSPAVVKEANGTFLYIGDNSGFVHKYQDCLEPFTATSPCSGPGGASVADVVEVWDPPVRIGSKVRASPVIGDDGTVFIGSSNGFMALDPETGAILDTFDTGGFVTSTAALAADGTLYVGSQSAGKKKYLFALKWSGSELTKYWMFGPVTSEADMSPFPVVGGDGIVYATIGRGVYAIAKAAGANATATVLWSYPLPSLSLNHPAIGGTANERILYVTTSSGRLYKFSSPR